MDEVILLKDLSSLWIAAFLGGLVSVFLRQHMIGGYILAGMAVGPFGLKLLSNSEHISSLAEFGVIMLLFVLGLEVSFQRVVKSSPRYIYAGVAQMIFTAGLAAALAMLCGLTETNIQAIAFGFVCALSSTVVVSKLLVDRQEFDSLHGQILLPILLVQDLFLLPIMAFMSAIQGPGQSDFTSIAISIVKPLVMIVILLYASWKLVPPLLRYIASYKSRELFLLSVITICLTVALLTKEFGLSLALGAFLGGIIVSQSTYVHQIVSDMSALKNLFATVFFLSVGLMLDPRFIADHFGEVLCFVFVLIVGKAIVASISARLAIADLRVALLVGFALSQIGEFSILLATLVLKEHLFSDRLFNLILSATVISIILSPVLMNLAVQLGSYLARRKNKERNDLAELSEHNLSFSNHIVVCGFGRSGRNVCRIFSNYEIPYVVIELNPDLCEELALKNVPHVFGDVINTPILKLANIGKASCLILTVHDLIATMSAISYARQVNPSINIIVRSNAARHMELYKSSGANAVVQPEFEASVEIVKLAMSGLNVSNKRIKEALIDLQKHRYESIQTELNLSEDLPWFVPEFDSQDSFGIWYKAVVQIPVTMQELNMRAKTGASILAINRSGLTIPYPDSSVEIRHGDQLYVVGTSSAQNEIKNTFLQLQAVEKNG